MKIKVVIKIWLVFLMCLLGHQLGYAMGLKRVTDLDRALEKAKEMDKMLFIQIGRSSCGNCQHLKELIRTKKIELDYSEFIYVDLNYDSKKDKSAFKERYTVEGSTFPFVVITNTAGDQLVSRSGYGEASEYNDIIQKAKELNKDFMFKKDKAIIDASKNKPNGKAEDKKVKTLDDIRQAAGWELPARKN